MTPIEQTIAEIDEKRESIKTSVYKETADQERDELDELILKAHPTLRAYALAGETLAKAVEAMDALKKTCNSSHDCGEWCCGNAGMTCCKIGEWKRNRDEVLASYRKSVE